MTSGAAPAITIAIPTRNRGARILPALRSVLDSRYPSFDVVVVDQSTDGSTKEAVAQIDDPRLRYVASDEVGNTRARNRALELATGAFVVFTDDDCVVPEGYAATMAGILASNPQVAVVFCNVEAAPHDPTAGFVPAYVRRGDKVVRTPLDKCRARGIGAGMAVRRDVALALGGFDEHLQACPDGDIAVRAVLAGHHVYETSRVAVLHDGFRTWAQGRDLARRNWIAIGASYAKPLRAGHLRFAVVVAYEGLVVALLSPLSRTVLTRRPQGLRAFPYFWRGFARGWRTPLDRRRLLYAPPGAPTP